MAEDIQGAQYYMDEEVAEVYDEKRFSGDGGRYIRERERAVFLDLVGDVAGKTVLDVATGTGRLALDLARAGADVTATDVSAEMLDEARAKADDHGVDIDFFQADAEELPEDADSYDIVTSQRFLHLVEDHRPYVEEMHRVARERVVYDYFNFWSLRLAYDWLLPMGSYLHRPRAVRRMLRDVGLTDLEERRRFFLPYGLVRHRSGPHIRAVNHLNTALSRMPLLRHANSVVYVAGDVL